jgi:hypothetical protein
LLRTVFGLRASSFQLFSCLGGLPEFPPGLWPAIEELEASS